MYIREDKKNLFILMISATVSGVLVICTLAQNLRNEKALAKLPLDEPSQMEIAGYTLKKYENSLGVFRGNSEYPYRIIPCNLNLLSEYDIEQLETGIEFDTESEINVLLEDLIS